MHRSAPLAVAPARHDHRAAHHARALLAGPAHGVEKALRGVGFPVGQEKLRVRGHGVDHLRAEDAMLTVTGLEIAIGAEGFDGYSARERFTELALIAAKTRIENGDLDAPTAVSPSVPALDTRLRQHAQATAQTVEASEGFLIAL